MKQYIGISRDHSASMGNLTKAAMKDYNGNIEAIREAATSKGIDTIVSVVKCGHQSSATVYREVINSSINALKPLTLYEANAGGTPLYDSVGELITMLEATPDANDKDTSFLVMAITDGEENHSYSWTAWKLSKKIQELQATDRWTFVFRVPRGYGAALASRLGIHPGNILEWDQTEKGVEKASVATETAFRSYFDGRATRGMTASKTFYADVADLTAKEVKANLRDISKEVSIWTVPQDEHDEMIKPFCEKRLNHTMQTGAAFYELTKPEAAVQDYKLICIRDKTTGAVYGGDAARNMLGLPHIGSVKLKPGVNGQWDVFVQSTSVNRKLKSGTDLLYWPKASK